jgi:hypothetical protein
LGGILLLKKENGNGDILIALYFPSDGPQIPNSTSQNYFGLVYYRTGLGP